MTDMMQLVNQLLPGVNDVFGKEVLESGTINLPADNIGFWLTQGVPFGLIFVHLMMALINDRDYGRCFVPNTGDEALTNFQVQYITELCLDQATHYNCFNEDEKLTQQCQSNFCSLDEMTNSSKTSNGHWDIFESLFFYRYYVWFLISFTFIRALPQIVWKLYRTADVRKAVHNIAIIAEFQHAMCGVMSLVNEDDSVSQLHTRIWNNVDPPNWMNAMNRIVIEEVRKRATQKGLFWFYIFRKIADIALDLLIVIMFICFQCYRTPFNHLVFVCDLHNDRDNIFLCDTFHKRFLSCTVSFGFEFVITSGIVFFVMLADLVMQTCSTLSFTRVGHLIIRRLSCGILCRVPGNFWDPIISQELELDKNTQWLEFDKSFMKHPDLYLVGLLYRQSNVIHRHFLKMMAEKMMEQLRPAFDYLRQRNEVQEGPNNSSMNDESRGNSSNENANKDSKPDSVQLLDLRKRNGEKSPLMGPTSLGTRAFDFESSLPYTSL